MLFGFYVFILVISVVFRYILEEYRLIDYFVKYFGENIYNYFIVFFVWRDELEVYVILLKDYF